MVRSSGYKTSCGMKRISNSMKQQCPSHTCTCQNCGCIQHMPAQQIYRVVIMSSKHAAGAARACCKLYTCGWFRNSFVLFTLCSQTRLVRSVATFRLKSESGRLVCKVPVQAAHTPQIMYRHAYQHSNQTKCTLATATRG